MTEPLKITDPCWVSQVLKDPAEQAATVDGTGLATGTNLNPLNIALIDCHQLNQECLAKAIEALEPQSVLCPFETVKTCISSKPADINLIVYYVHSNDAFEGALTRDIAALRQLFLTTPIAILSDAAVAQNPTIIRNMLKHDVQGFIPTRTTNLQTILATIRFIVAGGVFAPLDLLLTTQSDSVREMTPLNQLTRRQLTVLSYMQQGKANKLIAYELGMSESTVKVHVRNIMRKMGATNRTQVAYKANQLWGNSGAPNISDAYGY